MDDPALIQAITAIVTALITAIASIVVTIIQTSKQKEAERPKILLPSGVKISHRKRTAIPLIVLLTLLGGALGYFVSGSLSAPLPPSDPPFFVDEFLSYDHAIWQMESPNTMNDPASVQNGRLYFDYTNDGSNWSSQNISAKNFREYSAIEFELVILEASGSSTITFNTNCQSENTGSLFVEVGWNHRISGNYEVYDSVPVDYKNDTPRREEREWANELALGESYTILLKRDNDWVRVYINDIETQEPFPCRGIGPNLIFGSTAAKGHHIKGYIEYVRAWK